MKLVHTHTHTPKGATWFSGPHTPTHTLSLMGARQENTKLSTILSIPCGAVRAKETCTPMAARGQADKEGSSIKF